MVKKAKMERNREKAQSIVKVCSSTDSHPVNSSYAIQYSSVWTICVTISTSHDDAVLLLQRKL
jgi:hypothetical protein